VLEFGLETGTHIFYLFMMFLKCCTTNVTLVRGYDGFLSINITRFAVWDVKKELFD
jgi:hypothetical protein